MRARLFKRSSLNSSIDRHHSRPRRFNSKNPKRKNWFPFFIPLVLGSSKYQMRVLHKISALLQLQGSRFFPWQACVPCNLYPSIPPWFPIFQHFKDWIQCHETPGWFFQDQFIQTSNCLKGFKWFLDWIPHGYKVFITDKPNLISIWKKPIDFFII